MIHRRTLGALAFGASAGLAPRAGHAQEPWPTRPVRIIVPFPPGGATDVLVRFYAERLTGALGQPVVVDNRPGASGNIGIDAVAKATDGHTLGAITVSIMAINQFLFRRMPFDAERDLAPIALSWEQPNVAIVAADRVPARTLQEFIAWAKARPNGVTYGSTGIGATTHLSSALLFSRTGVNAVHVPFRGAAQTIPALLSGDVDFALDGLASYIPLIRDGKMRAFAVTSAERWPSMPEIPTMAEAGMPDFVVTVWGGFVAPARGPRAAVERMNAALRTIAADPTIQERFLTGGARAIWTTPEEAAARAARERPMWSELVRISGAQAD